MAGLDYSLADVDTSSIPSPKSIKLSKADSSNIASFKSLDEIDGFLIGGASKSSKKFIDIIKNYYR